MEYFTYQNAELYCEEVPIGLIAKKVKTPVYVYSARALRGSFDAFDRAMADRSHLVCFAVKANSNIAVLQLLGKYGAGADIVSGGELFRSLKAGIDPQKIVYSGVGKTDQEIKEALKAGIFMFNVESLEELSALNAVAVSMHTKAPVAFRVNPNVDPKTHPYISTGLKENKFGIAYEDVINAYEQASKLPGIAIKGISCHIGSQLCDLDPFREASKLVVAMVKKLSEKGIPTACIDLGGGLGVRYNPEDVLPPGPETYVKALLAEVGDMPHTIVLEPGRAVCANAGTLITKVLYRKKSGEHNFYIVDAAMNDLARPSLYGAYHHIEPVDEVANTRRRQICNVVGPICETGDFIAKKRELPLMKKGELLAVRSAGAYGFSMSSQYNSRPRAAEVLVDGKDFFVIRKRETHSRLVQDEKLLLM